MQNKPVLYSNPQQMKQVLKKQNEFNLALL